MIKRIITALLWGTECFFKTLAIVLRVLPLVVVICVVSVIYIMMDEEVDVTEWMDVDLSKNYKLADSRFCIGQSEEGRISVAVCSLKHIAKIKKRGGIIKELAEDIRFVILRCVKVKKVWTGTFYHIEIKILNGQYENQSFRIPASELTNALSFSTEKHKISLLPCVQVQGN